MFTTDEVKRLHEAHKEINELKKFIVQRAEMYLYMTTKKLVELKTQNGFAAKVYEFDIFSDKEEIPVHYVDSQGGWEKVYKVPRDFVFATAPSAEEERFQEYLKLKEEFGQ